eukprot:2142406-Heterocapsa_arctica.AAC.1
MEVDGPDMRPILEQLLNGPIRTVPPLEGPQFPPLPAPGEHVGTRPGPRQAEVSTRPSSGQE